MYPNWFGSRSCPLLHHSRTFILILNTDQQGFFGRCSGCDPHDLWVTSASRKKIMPETQSLTTFPNNKFLFPESLGLLHHTLWCRYLSSICPQALLIRTVSWKSQFWHKICSFLRKWCEDRTGGRNTKTHYILPLSGQTNTSLSQPKVLIMVVRIF